MYCLHKRIKINYSLIQKINKKEKLSMYIKVFKNNEYLTNHLLTEIDEEPHISSLSVEERNKIKKANIQFIPIPKNGGIIKDPNADYINKSECGLYFADAKYYWYYKDWGKYVAEVLSIDEYPCSISYQTEYDEFDNNVTTVHFSVFKSPIIKIGPLMKKEKFEEKYPELLEIPKLLKGDIE